MEFRKRPVVINATQWFKNGDHPLDYAKPSAGFSGEYCKAMGWEGQIVRYYRHPEHDGRDVCPNPQCGKIMHEHGWIDTLEGSHTVCPGDWIITGVKGEHYPCKPDIFALTYEPAEPVFLNVTIVNPVITQLTPSAGALAADFRTADKHLPNADEHF